MKKAALLSLSLVGIFLFALGSLVPRESPQDAAAAGTNRQISPLPVLDTNLRSDLDFGRMPLHFVANEGQIDRRVGYYVLGKDKSLYFTGEGMTVVMNGASERWAVKLDFVGADPDVRPEGEEKSEAVVSHFRGRPADWRTGLSTYSKIVYRGLWPGIDLVYSGTMQRLKYEFIVHPGADPSQIRLAYRGAEAVRISEEGRLLVETPVGSYEDDVPSAYQELGGEKRGVALSYVLGELKTSGLTDSSDTPESQEATEASQACCYGFEVGAYDRSRPLVLDPAVLFYCGYIGGSDDDKGFGIAVDNSGNVYVTGWAFSTEATFPVSVGPDLSFNAGGTDAFVAKVNATGTSLLYCGYIGGASYDAAYGVAVDSSGNAYVTGYTVSDQSTFPVTVGPDLTHNGSPDAFVAKVNAAGTALVYCGYIGGLASDSAADISVDGSGNAYVTGYTESDQSTFPEAVGPDLFHNGGQDAFVAKVIASGAALAYCGYIGGSGNDTGQGIGVDGSGNAYITGYTDSTQTTFPETVGPDLTHNGGQDAFVAKVNASGASLNYCGYIGGSDTDNGLAIAVDGFGYAYVSGHTRSTEATFPVAVGPDLTQNGEVDAFVAKVNVPGTALSYCGYIGGSNYEYGRGIAVDSSGSAYVTGNTSSSEATFPVKDGPGNLIYRGGTDAFVAKVSLSGSTLNYCGYIGGTGSDFGYGIAVDGSGNAYLTGYASSDQATFPVLTGPDLTHNGAEDIFVARVFEEPIWKPRHAVGDFDGDVADEAVVDFGTTGIYMYDGGAWTQLSASNPESLVAADVDGDNVDELLADLGTSGLWLWNAGAWSQLSGVNVEGIAAGDVDADGADEVVGDFGTVGMWLWNGGAWSQVSGVNADYLGCANLDGSGGEEIVGDFGSTGLWIWNTGAWTQLSGINADYMILGVAPGGTRKDLVGDFGSFGMWLWSGTSGWTQLSGLNADFMVPMQADVDAQDELVCDFGDVGMWFWDDGVWDQNSGANAEYMIIMDVDNDGIDEGAVDFGSLGLWLGSTSGGWTQLSGVDPEYMMAGDFDGDYDDEFLTDFGALGLWLWNGGAWSQVSSNDPE